MSAEPNIQGDFVLPWDTTATQLRITCNQASLLFALSDTFDPTGATATQFTIPNPRPRIDPIRATAGGADARQGVAPSTVVSLATTVTDPDTRDSPRFHWKAPAVRHVAPSPACGGGMGRGRCSRLDGFADSR